MTHATTEEPIEWKIRFQEGDKPEQVTDRHIAIGQFYACANPLPEDANTKQYQKFNTLWTRPVRKTFSFDEMRVLDCGAYEGPDHLALSQKYISYLLRRIPEKLLSFGITGEYDDVTRIYREDEHVGLLMPFGVTPPFGKKLIADAHSGDAFAQMHLGRHYQFGFETPIDCLEAAKWYEQAILQDQRDAYYYLAQLYFFGNGLEENIFYSMHFWSKAIELGRRDALEMRNKMLKMLSPVKRDAVNDLIGVTDRAAWRC